MSNYSLSISTPIPAGAPIDASIFPTLAGAVATIAQSAWRQWQAYAQGAPLPNGQTIGTRSGTYHRSIQIERTGPFAFRIFSDLAYADAIERGMPARDLKRMLDSSLKVRRSKDGKRYLIIPFRWGTPGTVGFGQNVMPQAVHDFFTPPGVARSHVTGMGSRVSGTGASDIKTRQPLLTPQASYQWGARLTAKHLGAMGIGGQTAKRMAGMVNMRQPGATGGATHSQYLTFRVMTEDSPGWKARAIPGKYPAKTVMDKIKPIAEQAFKKAMEEDVRRYFGG